MENIEISKAAVKEKLPKRFLKDVAKIVAKPISEICNLSIPHGTFPNACKVSKLKAIIKKCKKVNPSNCRPISLLPEKIHGQANEFLPDSKITD